MYDGDFDKECLSRVDSKDKRLVESELQIWEVRENQDWHAVGPVANLKKYRDMHGRSGDVHHIGMKTHGDLLYPKGMTEATSPGWLMDKQMHSGLHGELTRAARGAPSLWELGREHCQVYKDFGWMNMRNILLPVLQKRYAEDRTKLAALERAQSTEREAKRDLAKQQGDVKLSELKQQADAKQNAEAKQQADAKQNAEAKQQGDVKLSELKQQADAKQNAEAKQQGDVKQQVENNQREANQQADAQARRQAEEAQLTANRITKREI